MGVGSAVLLRRCCSDACFAAVSSETRKNNVKKNYNLSTVAPLSVATIQLQHSAIHIRTLPHYYRSDGSVTSAVLHGCMSGLPNTRTFTLLPPLVSFLVSAAPLLSGSLVVVSRPVDGLGVPQRDVQSSGREASWLLARFTSCRENGIPKAVQARFSRCTEI
jgi:hypothetical protein